MSPTGRPQAVETEMGTYTGTLFTPAGLLALVAMLAALAYLAGVMVGVWS